MSEKQRLTIRTGVVVTLYFDNNPGIQLTACKPDHPRCSDFSGARLAEEPGRIETDRALTFRLRTTTGSRDPVGDAERPKLEYKDLRGLVFSPLPVDHDHSLFLFFHRL